MKIAQTGLDVPEGKLKYPDPLMDALIEKFKPAKISPYYFEILPDAYDESVAIAVSEEQVLDLLVLDMERLERRMDRSLEAAEKALIEKGLEHLEKSLPLCDLPVTPSEAELLRTLGPHSLKPTVVVPGQPAQPGDLLAELLAKSGMMFFYTAGKQEVHAWIVERGTDAVTCASKIHTDLARGFIKAEIVPFKDLMTAHSFSDARSKGLTKLVDRDYIIEEETVLEIRFNV